MPWSWCVRLLSAAVVESARTDWQQTCGSREATWSSQRRAQREIVRRKQRMMMGPSELIALASVSMDVMAMRHLLGQLPGCACNSATVIHEDNQACMHPLAQNPRGWKRSKLTSTCGITSSETWWLTTRFGCSTSLLATKLPMR